MIIWSGLGFLVALVAFGCLLGAEYVVEAAFQDDQYYQTHGWPMHAAFVVAAAIVGPLGFYLNRRGARRLIDPQTNREVTLRKRHSLFFIPMEYWGLILPAIGALFLLLE